MKTDRISKWRYSTQKSGWGNTQKAYESPEVLGRDGNAQ